MVKQVWPWWWGCYLTWSCLDLLYHLDTCDLWRVKRNFSIHVQSLCGPLLQKIERASPLSVFLSSLVLSSELWQETELVCHSTVERLGSHSPAHSGQGRALWVKYTVAQTTYSHFSVPSETILSVLPTVNWAFCPQNTLWGDFLTLKVNTWDPDRVTHICTSITWEVETEVSWIQGYP